MSAATRAAPGRVSVGHIALAVPIIAAVISGRIPVRDNSYLWHVRAGTLQIDLGRVLTEDPFSFTAAGRAWRTQSWLADLFYGWADRKWGLAVVTPIVVVGALLIVGSIAVRNYRVLQSPLAAALATTWVMWLLIGYFTPRPVVFSLGFLALMLWWPTRSGSGGPYPLDVALGIVHGGFVVGSAIWCWMGSVGATGGGSSTWQPSHWSLLSPPMVLAPGRSSAVPRQR